MVITAVIVSALSQSRDDLVRSSQAGTATCGMPSGVRTDILSNQGAGGRP